MRTLGQVMVEQGFSMDDVLGGSSQRRAKGEVEWLPCSDEILRKLEVEARTRIRRFQKPRISLLKDCLKTNDLAPDEKHTVGLIEGYFKRNHFIVDSQVAMMAAIKHGATEFGDEGVWEEEL